VLVTTHSPALLDHFSADQIRVVELVDLETQIGRLAEEQKQSLVEELLRAGELLTVDPARRQAG
jgi:mRNA-degrading endonuclease toxin of MazEF toxin-antitoxin module